MNILIFSMFPAPDLLNLITIFKTSHFLPLNIVFNEQQNHHKALFGP